jgi:replicative DNA helicase
MATTDAGRPQSARREAERAVLSAMAHDASARAEAIAFLQPAQISEGNRELFAAIVDLANANTRIDADHVEALLVTRDQLTRVGGRGRLTELLGAPVVSDVRSYIRTILRAIRDEEIVARCRSIATQGFVDHEAARGLMDSIEPILFDASDEGSSPQKLLEVMRESFQRMNRAVARGDRMTGWSTGFDAYDRMTAGLHAGEVTLVAGWPGVGKTSFALGVGRNMTRSYLCDPADACALPWVAVFSLETCSEQIMQRIVCAEASVDLSKLRAGYLDPQDWKRLTEAASTLGARGFWVDDAQDVTVWSLRTKLRKLRSESTPAAERVDDAQPALVIIDGLERMLGRARAVDRAEAFSKVLRGVKLIAKELRLPILALCKLKPVAGGARRARLGDLRALGINEGDVDNVVLVHCNDGEPRAQLAIARQRNGPTGVVSLRFAAEFARFEDPHDQAASSSTRVASARADDVPF